jgi:hypothetical protein
MNKPNFTHEELGYIRGTIKDSKAATELALRLPSLSESSKLALYEALELERSILAKVQMPEVQP